MTDGTAQGSAGRQLRDPGRFLVVLVAPLLTRWTNRDKRFVWTVDEVRGHGRNWPRSADDAEMANLFRAEVWLGLSLMVLAIYIAASLTRGAAGSPGPAWHEGVMTVAVTVGMFLLGMFGVSGYKWALCQYFRPDLDRRLGPPSLRELRLRREQGFVGDTRRRRPGLLVRLCLPSNLDAVFALFFMSCMAPNFYA